MMRHQFTAALVLAIITAASSPARSKERNPRADIATIADGTLRGVQIDGVVAFKGIPFAAPPVGPLRWRAPRLPAAWRGERDAGAYGHDCMQLPFATDAAPLATLPAEDCLYLNVWKPASTSARTPVLVWIYGGGFVNGGSSPPTYSGEALARRGIVFVSFNYRLGRFGTFAHPALSRVDADHGLLANYGYLDQIAALRWVHRHITAFGGDPGNVTIVGESAGGFSIHALITSPLSRGLFARAVIQSGGNGTATTGTIVSAQAAGIAFAQSRGIKADDPHALDKLRALPADAIVEGLNLASVSAPSGEEKTYVGPVIDGRIAVDALEAYRRGQFVRVPVILGATSDDIGGTSGVMISGARDVARALAAQGVPVYYYRFSYVASSLQTFFVKGAPHASDIPFFFATEALKYGDATMNSDRAAGNTASGYLINFVKAGNPDGAGLPRWPRYTVEGGEMLDLNANGGATLVSDNAGR